MSNVLYEASKKLFSYNETSIHISIIIYLVLLYISTNSCFYHAFYRKTAGFITDFVFLLYPGMKQTEKINYSVERCPFKRITYAFAKQLAKGKSKRNINNFSCFLYYLRFLLFLFIPN